MAVLRSAVRRWLLAPSPLGLGSENTSPPALDRASISRIAARVRGRHLVVPDLLGCSAAAYLAVVLSQKGNTLEAVAPILALLISIRLAIGIRLGLYRRDWRFASVPDLIRIAIVVGLGSTLAATVMYTAALAGRLDRAAQVPGAFWTTEMLLALGALGSSRFGIRAASDWASQLPGSGTVERRATLLYGAGRLGVLMARAAQRNPGAGVKPVGFLDDDPSLKGSIIGGLRVFGPMASLESALAETGAKSLLITMPGAPGITIRRAVELSMALGLEVRTVPSMDDLLDGSIDAYRPRTVRVEDLLRRPIVTEHSSAVREIIQDQTVLITGAGGSIGSELARQVFAIGPRRLILLDRAESALYLIERELAATKRQGASNSEVRVHLANVASRAAMERLISAEKPNVIFHAAAYKHVPMLENHPSDAVHVNIAGTLFLLDAAVMAGVERFVLVSTDKAVRPSSVMGASKRVAEMLVADTARRIGRPYVSVRFGNVLGSTGSVVPIFQAQLEKNRPLTVTHPDMTRFFMTIPEASWLILDAAALGEVGDLFVLDMGDPVRIMDLARDVARLAGRDPESQPIEIVGIRPGEKLHEELFYDIEHVIPTRTEKVLRSLAQSSPSDVRSDVSRLLAMATGQLEPQLRTALLEFAQGTVTLRPSGAYETPLAEGDLVEAAASNR